MPASSLLILGIDPGTLVTGYGIIEKKQNRFSHIASGVIRTSAQDKLPIRLRKIYDQMVSIIDAYHPDECGIETAFYGRNIQSTMKLGHARGVAILAAVHREVPVSEYSPREVKRSVTGNGASSKQQVSYMVQTIFKLKSLPSSHDISDALAIAFCHAQHLTSPRTHFKNWSSFVNEHPERIRRSR